MTSSYERIRDGMDVVDLAGAKIGTVQRVAGLAAMPDTGNSGEGVGRDMEAKRAGKGGSGHIEIHTGGKQLFVPLSAVNDVQDNAVRLIVDKNAVDSQGWERAPR